MLIAISLGFLETKKDLDSLLEIAYLILYKIVQKLNISKKSFLQFINNLMVPDWTSVYKILFCRHDICLTQGNSAV